MKILLIAITLITQLNFAESLSSIDKKINQSSSTSTTTSSSSSTSNYYKEQSGYTTEVHVIGSERKFDPIRFTTQSFEQWRQLYVDAQTYDLIVQLKENGYVNFDGTLNFSVVNLAVPLTPNQVINRNQIRTYYLSKYTTTWIINQLKQAGVLDEQGFLTNTANFSESYNPKDFNKYIKNLNRIEFNFSNKTISNVLQTELLRVIKQNSLSIHVTQEETTRYQSRKEGFLESFVDQLGGNVLGNIFYKDQIKTVKRKMAYSPNINIYTLFTNITFGFAEAPYAKGAEGNMIYYGKSDQKNILVSFGNNDSGNSKQHLGVKLSFLSQLNQNAFQGERINATGPGVYFNEIRDASGQVSWMSLRYLFYSASKFKFGNQFSMGISNYTSTFRGDSQLGLALGWEGNVDLARFFGFYYNIETNFGFDLFDAENTTTWLVSRYGLGLETTLSPVNFRIGYEWIVGQDSALLFDGLVISSGIYF